MNSLMKRYSSFDVPKCRYHLKDFLNRANVADRLTKFGKVVCEVHRKPMVLGKRFEKLKF